MRRKRFWVIAIDFWGLIRPTPDQDFTPVMAMNFPWTAPTLGIRFEMFETRLDVFYPNGDRFQDPEAVIAERDRAFAKLKELGIDPSQL
jgi:hypothetical protein